MNTNVYVLDASNKALSPIPAKPMIELGFKETDVETWLASVSSDTNVLGRPILWLARQDSQADDQRSDLVGLDIDGDLLVVELKRGVLDESTITQALSYAAEYYQKTADELAEMYADHCTKGGTTRLVAPVDSVDAAKERIGKHVKAGSKVNALQILVLVGEDFTARALAVCDYLNCASGEAPFTVECWQYAVLKPQDDQHQFLVNQILPPMSIRHVIEEKREIHKSRTYARDSVRAEFMRALVSYLVGQGVACYKRQGETYKCHLRHEGWPEDVEIEVWNHLDREQLQLRFPPQLAFPNDELTNIGAAAREDEYGRYIAFDEVRCASAVFTEELGDRIIQVARELSTVE